MFTVLVLQRGDVTGSLRIPVLDPESELPDIKGAHTPAEILVALGIRPELLGY